jgi:hypothetical protein
MSDRIPLGETRPEAISRVQERLGPAASRPLAEQTFWSLARKGKITMDQITGSYLIEAEIDDNSLKQEATQTIQQATQTQTRMNRSRGIRGFTLNHNNMHQARVSTTWKALSTSAKSMFAPSSFKEAGVENSPVDQNLAVVMNTPPPSDDPNNNGDGTAV